MMSFTEWLTPRAPTMTNTRSVDESERHREMVSFSVCVFITAVPIIKLFAWGEGNSGGHVLRATTSRGRCGLVCPSRTTERGGEEDCVKEGGGEGEHERERALGLLLCHSPTH